MERKWHRHDRRAISLLADHIQNIGAAKPNAEYAIALAMYSCTGFGDFECPSDMYILEGYLSDDTNENYGVVSEYRR
jgi:hypothetical protein